MVCRIAVCQYQREQALTLRVVAVVPNPIVVDAFPFQADKEDFLPGQEEFFHSEVQPHIDDEQICYIGEIGDEKKQLYARAAALLMPIRWPEPFGLVMTEAMACGTPVIAYPEGAAPEIVVDGETGFLVDDESEMAQAIKRLGEIDPSHCRESAEERFDVAAVTEAHERAYREVITQAADRTGA